MAKTEREGPEILDICNKKILKELKIIFPQSRTEKNIMIQYFPQYIEM